MLALLKVSLTQLLVLPLYHLVLLAIPTSTLTLARKQLGTISPAVPVLLSWNQQCARCVKAAFCIPPLASMNVAHCMLRALMADLAFSVETVRLFTAWYTPFIFIVLNLPPLTASYGQNQFRRLLLCVVHDKCRQVENLGMAFLALNPQCFKAGNSICVQHLSFPYESESFSLNLNQALLRCAFTEPVDQGNFKLQLLVACYDRKNDMVLLL